MNVGVLREIKDKENRVALTPEGAKQLVDAGHTVFFERKCGAGSGLKNRDYEVVGAKLVESPKELARECDLVVKVKEPVEEEHTYFDESKMLFTYFHFASSCELTENMLKSGAACIAYETVEDKNGKLPLLRPMSEVAGKMSAQMGAYYLMKHKGGKGILIGGVTGAKPATVVIVGGGVVGKSAAEVAIGMGAETTILDINSDRVNELTKLLPNANVLQSSPEIVDEWVKKADVLIGAVLVPGAKAPKVVSAKQIHSMRNGSVVVDVAIDQGGCIETARPTSHSGPTYEVGGVVHYCVTNMPGAFCRTSTYALAEATIPYLMKLADKGLKALKDDAGFMKGLNMYKGKVTNKGVADAFNKEYFAPQNLID